MCALINRAYASARLGTYCGHSRPTTFWEFSELGHHLRPYSLRRWRILHRRSSPNSEKGSSSIQIKEVERSNVSAARNFIPFYALTFKISRAEGIGWIELLDAYPLSSSSLFANFVISLANFFRNFGSDGISKLVYESPASLPA